MKLTKHLIIHGHVQGVGFREHMRMEAARLGVTGWVRNRADGSVEAVVQGWPEDVSKILNWARNGPHSGRVTSMQVNEASGDYETFERRPSA